MDENRYTIWFSTGSKLRLYILNIKLDGGCRRYHARPPCRGELHFGSPLEEDCGGSLYQDFCAAFTSENAFHEGFAACLVEDFR